MFEIPKEIFEDCVNEYVRSINDILDQELLTTQATNEFKNKIVFLNNFKSYYIFKLDNYEGKKK